LIAYVYIQISVFPTENPKYVGITCANVLRTVVL